MASDGWLEAIITTKLSVRLVRGSVHLTLVPGRGGGVLLYKRLMGVCRWMGSHFHDWSDYSGVAFSIL